MAIKGERVPGTTEGMSADLAELLKRVRTGHREGHYYAALLGLRRYDSLHLVQQIRRGLAYSAFERFQRNTALSLQLLAHVVEIPERTLARRRESGRLEPDESDRLVRTSRVFARAMELFEGNVRSAARWLTTPLPALGDNAPLEFARTTVGAIEVERLIGRLEHGLPA